MEIIIKTFLQSPFAEFMDIYDNFLSYDDWRTK